MCMGISHLRYVVAAAEHCSFRRAAAALNITQPTLSKRIRDIEEWLGVPLFERSTCGAQLTTEGKTFIEGAKRVLAELERMQYHAKAAKLGDAGRMDIGYYTSLAGPLRDAVLTFAREHAEVDVNMVEDSRATLIPLLDRGAIDIALVLGEPVHRDYEHLSLWSERILVALPSSHPLAERSFVYWTDLKTERFLISQRDPGPEIQDILLSKLASPGSRPFIKHVKAHHSATISAVEGGCGITLTCESSSIPLWPGVIFREVRDGNGSTRLGFVAYWRRNNDNPTLKQFLTLLRTHSAALSRITGVT